MSDVIKKCTAAMYHYAQRIGADYKLETNPDNVRIPGLSPYVRALDGFYNPEYAHYDNVVVVDGDVSVRRNLSESIFATPGHLAYPEPKEHNRWRSKRSRRNIPIFPQLGGNGGVYKLNRLERHNVAKVLPAAIEHQLKYYAPHTHEEYVMHTAWFLADIDTVDMGYRWNYTGGSVPYYPIDSGYFYHMIYHGSKEDTYKLFEDYL